MNAATKVIRVLFVCLGNICRSPMAEAVFARKVRDAKLEDSILADSAGTGGWHIGSPPHPETQRVLKERSIHSQHRARQITPSDLNRFDYILTMDEQNYREVLALGSGTAKVVRFLSYAPELGRTDVPDPYYVGGYEGVYALVKAASTGLLAAIREENELGNSCCVVNNSAY